jgi:hypothetical protein
VPEVRAFPLSRILLQETSDSSEVSFFVLNEKIENLSLWHKIVLKKLRTTRKGKRNEERPALFASCVTNNTSST